MSFNPQEIIFSVTTSCNLSCSHCFVNRNPKKLDIQKAKKFLLSCKTSDSNITKIGFTGGEPFLYLDFLVEIIKYSISLDYMFDQIMTNGNWWTSEDDLTSTLQKLYDAEYDGKFGLSWDEFHAQKTEKMLFFIKTVQNIFGNDSINIQTVIPFGADKNYNFFKSIDLPENIQIYNLPQSFPAENMNGWTSKKWFKEDYCQGPGNIFYIHSDGSIAPCCGFANENPKLFIGTIDDSFDTLLENCTKSEMINRCYNLGLSKYKKILKKELRKEGLHFPGKTNDICTFCDFVCKQN